MQELVELLYLGRLAELGDRMHISRLEAITFTIINFPTK
jgi:hypothetical protein